MASSLRLRARLFLMLVSCAAMSLIALTFAACSSDNGEPGVDTPLDGSHSDAPSVDAGGNNNNKDTGASPDGSQDSGTGTDTGTNPSDTGTPDTGAPDTGPPDTTPPAKITDLAATPKSPSAINLTWTAPADNADAGTGTVAAYDLRYSKTPIATVTDFNAATAAATVPAPVAPGQPQTATVSNLDANTLYHFAVRARDAANNFADISNDASATTKARAKLLITEVAISNSGGATDGFDFIEAVVTQAGDAEGLEFKQLSASLYTLGAIDLALNDVVVVHMSVPAGSAQEDVTKDKTSSTVAFASANAYDVYSTTGGLTATDNLITINDGAAIVDALAFSNRDNDAATNAMTAWATAKTANAWTFGAVPVDATNDCATQRDTVNVTPAQTDLACGGFATAYAAGQSINRNGVVDTNGKADWFLAAQSPGAAGPAAPTGAVVVALAISTTSVTITFDHEIDPATVNAAAFTITPALNVTAATVTNTNVVTLTTDAQAGGSYQVAIGAGVKTSLGTAIVPPSARFCAFTAAPAILAVNEVSPDLTGGADLIELKVMRGGALFGFEVRANPSAIGASGTLLATLPAICGVTNDLIVVHLAPGVNVATETLSVNEQPTATFAANYDTAYDVRGGNSGIGFTSQVIAVRDSTGAYTEAAAFSNMTGAASATYNSSLTFVQGAGLWLPANCGGVVCTDATVPTSKGIAANWTGISGDLPTGPSISRSSTATQASSWAVGASSFGQ